MKKFKFRLEPFLRLKAYREKEEQKVHAAAAMKVLSQQEVLAEIGNDRTVNQDRLRNKLSGRLNLTQLLGFSRYFMKLKKNELVGSEMLKVFQKESEKKRLKLLEATRQRKIYEKLKDRHLEKYMKDYELIIQKEQDEIAAQMNRYKKGPH